jgi:peptidyl-dipeptidase A
MMGRQAREGGWLRATLGVDPGEVAVVEKASAAEARTQMLVCTRWMLVVMHFERAMYENPKQDLNRLWWDLVEEMQFLRRPNGRDAPDWASKIHVACYPVYYHNYLLGELLASQLRAVIDSDVLGGTGKAMTGNPAVGEFLRAKIFRPGARVRWDRLVKEATGSPLKPDAFVEEFLGA